MAPSSSDSFDVVVLGAGSGGYAAALRAAQLGLAVALVEVDKVGGTCLHRGCIPAKALLHAAEVADTVRRSSTFGVQATLERIDVPALNAYSEMVVARLYKGLTGLVSQRGITTVQGSGELVEVDQKVAVRVGDRTLRGTWTVVATGSQPRTLGLPIDGERILTSDHVWSMPALPNSAIVLGGGVIGVEIASAWASLGVEVTIIEALDRLVSTEEPEMSAALTKAFKRRTIAVRTGAAMASAESSDDGVTVTLDDGNALTAEVLLVAVGRAPVSENIGLDRIGVRTERGFVEVDQDLQTSRGGVFAVGDLVGGPQLAHRGFSHGIHVAERLAHLKGGAPAPVALPAEQLYPRVTFSHPQIASIGLTEAQARPSGTVHCASYSLAGNGKSQIMQTQGTVKVVAMVDGPVVGVHMVGDGVGELVSEAQTITDWQALPEEVAQLVHAHPTQSEALGEAMMALAGKPLHSHS